MALAAYCMTNSLKKSTPRENHKIIHFMKKYFSFDLLLYNITIRYFRGILCHCFKTSSFCQFLHSSCKAICPLQHITEKHISVHTKYRSLFLSLVELCTASGLFEGGFEVVLSGYN